MYSRTTVHLGGEETGRKGTAMFYHKRDIPAIKTVGKWLIVYTGWKTDGIHLPEPFGTIHTMENDQWVCKGRFGKTDDEFESESLMLDHVHAN